MEDPSRDKAILYGLSLRYGYFSWASSEIQKGFLAPNFYLIFFFLYSFLLCNKRILFLILLIRYGSSESFFYCEDLVFEGGASQLAVLILNISPYKIWKYDSACELVISVTLHIVRQTTANVVARHWLVDLVATNSALQASWAHGGVTIYIYIYIYMKFKHNQIFSKEKSWRTMLYKLFIFIWIFYSTTYVL